MPKSDEKDDENGNPYISAELCKAYRDGILAEIRGLKQTIKIVGLALGLAFAIFELVLKYGLV